MLHLPALVMEGNVGWALKMVGQMGLAIKGHWGDGDNSLGDMYQISNPVSLGLNEKEIVETVQSTAVSLMDYERKARAEMLKSRRVELEDAIYRAYGQLSQCRLISPPRRPSSCWPRCAWGSAWGCSPRPAWRPSRP